MIRNETAFFAIFPVGGDREVFRMGWSSSVSYYHNPPPPAPLGLAFMGDGGGRDGRRP